MSEVTKTAQQYLNNFLRTNHSKQIKITALDICVLHALASFCYYKLECFPSQKSLMSYTRLCLNSIKRSIKNLEKNGLISTEKSNGSRNFYELTIPIINDEEIYKPVSNRARL